jgi:hypothetical protein
MNNQSRAEGFFTYVIDYSGKFKGLSNLKPVDVDTLFKTAENNSKRLILKPFGAPRPYLYVYYVGASNNETALTWLGQCVDTVNINKNGSILPYGNEFFNGYYNVEKNRGLSPGVAFSFWGRWATQRVADLTPSDYFTETKPDSTFLRSIAITDSLKQNVTVKKLRNILLRFDIYSLLGKSTVYRPSAKLTIDSIRKANY